jgi:hypothetical protein
MKKNNSWQASCRRLGCMASLEGGGVESISQQELDEMFSGDCPHVLNKGKEMNHKQSVNYLLKYAKKEIRDWNKLIKYWENKD